MTVVPLLVSAIASMQPPVAVVLDHADAVTNPECLDTIAELALSLPAGSQFAIASRDDLPLPTARLRAEGGIVEVAADDLAMGPPEASRCSRARVPGPRGRLMTFCRRPRDGRPVCTSPRWP